MDWPVHIEKALPNNNYLVRKIGTNKTQVLHHKQIRQFTPHQLPAEIRITAREWKPDPEVSLSHGDFYARASEYDYEQPIFEIENKKAMPPNAHEVPLQSDFSNEELRNTPGNTHECSLEFFPQTEEIGDVTDTYPNMVPDVEKNSEQLNSTTTNPRSSKYNLLHNPIPKLNDDYRY